MQLGNRVLRGIGALITTLLVGSALGQLPASPAYAAAGDASARGIVAELGATVLGIKLLQLNGQVGAADAPAAGGTKDAAVVKLPLSGLGVSANADVDTITATKGSVQSSAKAKIAGLNVTLLGTSLLNVGALSGEVTCPATGKQTAVSSTTGVTLLGQAVNLAANVSVTKGLPITITGLVNARLFVTATRIENTTVNSANAAGLSVSVRLTADLGIDINLGTLSFATASCQKPAVPATTAASLSPSSGKQSGGTPITVTGTGFVPGNTTVTVGGAPATVTNVSADGNSLTYTAPAKPVGQADVVVTSAGGSSSALKYTYLADGSDATANAPDPASGFTAGGNTVTITGSGLSAATGVRIGGVDATGFTVNSAGTQATATVPSSEQGGDVGVVLVFPAGTVNAGTYTYKAPAITAVSPPQGPIAGGTPIELSGTGLSGAASVTIGGNPATGVTVNQAGTRITFTAPAHAEGLVDIVVPLPGADATLTNGYSYQPPGSPTISDVSPARGPTVGGTPVTLTGTNFTNVNSVEVNGQPATIDSGSRTATSLKITTPVSEDAGPVDIALSTSDNRSGTRPGGFTYDGPTLTAVSPQTGPQRGGVQVTLTGTGLSTATAVKVGGVNAQSIDSITPDGTTIIFKTPAGTPGDALITVAVTGHDPDPIKYTYEYDGSQATIGSVDPSPISTSGRKVTITGTNLTGATGVTFAGVPGTNMTVNSAGTAITVTAPTSETAGAAPVLIKYPAGSADAGTITYEGPSITSVTPVQGPAAGTNAVEIIGTGLTGATAVKFGDADATGVTANSAGTKVNATVPPHAAGVVDVTVVVSGLDAKSVSAYTYQDDGSASQVTGISPTSVPSSGGTVTITGTNLGAVTAVLIDGVPGTNLTVTPTQITVTVPPTDTPSDVPVALKFPSGTVNAGQLTYTAPTITSIQPGQGALAGGDTVTITGTGLSAATRVLFGGVLATDLTVTATGLTVRTPGGNSAGAVNVAVELPGADARVNNGFAYVAPGAPTVTNVSVPEGPSSGGTSVTLTGTNFDGVNQVTFNGVPGTDLTVNSATNLTVTTPASTDAGPVAIAVTSSAGTGVLPNGYTYKGPELTGISPANGRVAGGTTVTLTGTQLKGALSVKVGGVAVTAFTTTDGTITFATPAGVAGDAQVVVDFPGPDPKPVKFTYVADGSNTSVTNVAPSIATGGGQVTVTGTNLTGANAITFGGQPGSVVSVSADGTTLTATAPPRETAGPAALTIGFPLGTYEGGTAAYVAPKITTVAPDRGFVDGGTRIRISGMGLTGATAVTVGGQLTTDFAVDQNGVVTATVPAHAAGAVDVVVVLPGADATAVGGFTYSPLPPPTITGLSPTTSPTSGGEVVTLTGSNLSGATSVTIGGKPADIQGTPTDTQIRALVPASESDAPVDVAVVTPNGAALSASQLKYVAPEIRALDPASGSVSGGNSIVILGSGLDQATTVTIDNVTADITSRDPAGSAIVVKAPAHGPGTVDIAVTLPGMDAAKRDAYRYVSDGSNASVASLSPKSVPTAGSTVTLQGDNFTGATAVTFGGKAGDDFTIDPNGTRITVKAPETENTGDVPVQVWFPGGTFEAGTITYVAPAIYTVYPSQGPVAGGTKVTLTGIGFTGATQVTFDGEPATDVVVSGSGSTLTALTPAHNGAAVVNVVVVLPGRDASQTSAFAYLAPAAPSVDAITPAFGPTNVATRVSITGANLQNVTAVTFAGDLGSIVSTANNEIIVDVPARSQSGAVQVVLTTLGGATSTVPRGYYYAGPTVSSMSPTSGPAAGDTEVTIDGFALGGVQSVTVDGVLVTPEVNASGTRMKFRTPQGTPGPADVKLTYLASSPPVMTFTYIADGTGATVTAINPTSVPSSGGPVTLTGTGLDDATQVTFDGTPGTDMKPSSDGKSIVVTAPPSSKDSAEVVVVYPQGTKKADPTLTYDTPTITAVTPQAGAESGGTQVTLTGTGLAAATVVRINGKSVTFTPSADGTTITFVTPPGTAGDATVTVEVPGRSPEPGKFTYLADGSSTTATLSADTSLTAGGTTLTLFGTGLKSVSRVLVGTKAATNVVINTAGTSLTADIPSSEDAGAVDVTLVFPAGNRKVGALTYVAPTITAITPNSGTASGGTPVTITGTGLAQASAVRFDGLPGTNMVAAADGKSITVVTPTHAIGAVDVVVTLPGADATSTGGYTYVPATVPPISDSATTSSLTPPQIPTYGGSTVTITGTGLAGVTGVTFDGTAGTNVSASATQVTVTSPPHEQGVKPVVLVFSDNSTKPFGTIEFTPPAITSVVPPYANISGGTLVTINGINLQDAVRVTFDGVDGELLSAKAMAGTASVRAASSVPENRRTARILAAPPNSQVVAKAPARPNGTLADVSVILPGQDAASTNDVFYAAGPTADGMTPVTGPIAGGQTVTVTGSGFNTGTTVTFDGVAATGISVQSATTLTAVVPAHAVGQVYVVVTTDNIPAQPLSYTYYTTGNPGTGNPGTVNPGTDPDPDTDDPDTDDPDTDDPDDGTPGGPTTPKPKKPPVDVSVKPAKLKVDSGGLITVTGDNFVINGTTVEICGYTIPASEVIVGIGGTTASFRAPKCKAGKQSITLTTAGGSTEAEVEFAAASATTPDDDDNSSGGGRNTSGGTRTGSSNWLPTTGTDVTGFGIDGLALGGIVLLVLGAGCVWGARGLTVPVSAPYSTTRGRKMRSTRRRHGGPRTRMMGSTGLRAVLIAVPCATALVLAVAERPASASVVTGAPLVSPAFVHASGGARLVSSAGEASAQVMSLTFTAASVPTSVSSAPDPTAPEGTVPDPVMPAGAASDPIAPDPIAPDPIAPDPIAPDPVAPDPVAPDGSASDPVAPDPVAPGGTAPEGAEPGGTAPGGAAPGGAGTGGASESTGADESTVELSEDGIGTVVPVEFGALSRDGVGAVAPKSGDTTVADVPVSVDAGNLVARGLATKVTAVRQESGSDATADLGRFELTVLGTSLLSADRVHAQVTCPPEGSDKPTASTDVSGVLVAGEPAEFGGVPVTVPAEGVQLGVELQKIAKVDAGGAHASVEARISATGTDDAPVELGTIRLATASCLPATDTLPTEPAIDGSDVLATEPATAPANNPAPAAPTTGNAAPAGPAGGAVPPAAAGGAAPAAPAGGVVPAANAAPAGGAMPAANAAPADGVVPAANAAPADGVVPAANAAPAGGLVPAADAAPAGGVVPAADTAPAGGAMPAANAAPAGGGVPAADAAPGDGAVPAPGSMDGEGADSPAAVPVQVVEEPAAADPLLIAPAAAPVAVLPQSFTALAAPLTFERAPATGLRPPSLNAAAAKPRAAAKANPTINTLAPTRGPAAGGTKITITGSSLGGADTAVVICNAKVAANAVEVDSDGTSLTFTAPRCSAGTSVVHVITSGGVATSEYTYGGTTSAAGSTRQVSSSMSNSTVASPRNTLAATSPQNLAAGLIGALLLFAGIAARQAVRRGPVPVPARRGRHAMPHPEPRVIGRDWHPDLEDALRRRGA
ncbi:IPT/TIG domain-containing protein [Cryptosporangium sp. NPDC048952]|uniref:IPT/TIG domain-containing protein n=1 Tax=Cryptosporangium sp. NPDC048952 TaxID=3363961 RepID=UPI0037168D32